MVLTITKAEVRRVRVQHLLTGQETEGCLICSIGASLSHWVRRTVKTVIRGYEDDRLAEREGSLHIQGPIIERGTTDLECT